jgi:endonuclease/exonuclease/phosphatase (EEP) superfamily protein YafD
MQAPVKDPALPHARLLASVALAFLLAVPLGVAAAALSGVGHRWVDILAQFTGPALVVAVAVVAAAALLRSRGVLVAAVLVSALVLAAGSAQWATPRGQPGPATETLTLYSANLHRDNVDVPAIARSIAASDADVVVLVEVGSAPEAALDTILAGYPHRAVQGRPNVDDVALSVIASRRPLRDLNLRPRNGLSLAGAVVDTPLGPVTFAGAHLTRPWPYQVQWEQIRQAQRVAAWTRTVPGPLIVAGDFNSVSSARIGRLIQKESGLVPAPGWPGTWPAALPAAVGITIDQVYRTPDLALVERRLGRATGSDHRPVITRFVRAAPPPAP